MAALEILKEPAPCLRLVAKPVTTFDSALQGLIADMFDTLDAVGGIGLAAPQVGHSVRVIVMNVPDGDQGRLALVNPEIGRTAMPAIVEESCLSVPGLEGKVRRALRVEMKARSPSGEPLTLLLTNMEAVCAQHEIDHLEGVLFRDRLPWLTRWVAKLRR